MSNLSILQRFFSITGTAEGDRQILDAAYIDPTDSLSVINPPCSYPRLLIGRKGSGKSAYLRTFHNRFLSAGIPVLFLKPEHLDLDEFLPADSIGEMTKKAKACLLKSIAAQLGSQLPTFVTEKHDLVLNEYLTASGSKQKDLFRKFHDVLSQIGQAATGVDFAKITDSFQAVTEVQIRDAIYRNAGKNGKVFYVMIDDTDQVAAPTQPAHVNRIWAFILAARSILEECDEIKIVISLRLEVWIRLQRDNAAQRDQVDHFRGLVYELNPTEAHVKAVLLKRLELAKIESNHLGYLNKLDAAGNLYQAFFDGRDVEIPTSERRTSWEDLIVKRSRERPRDAIQFVAMLSEAAMKRKDHKISSLVVATTLKKYSKERVEDIGRETEVECPQLKEVIRSFSEIRFEYGSFKADADSIMKHLLKLQGRMGIYLFGITLNSNRNAAFKLWRYLFDIGFLGCRIETNVSNEAAKGFNHLIASSETDLIKPERWNELQKYVWEINPAYRDYLILESAKSV